MFEKLYPSEFADSPYVLDFKRLRGMGFKGIIFDIDNTFVPHGAPADERAIALFGRIDAAGLKKCAISNNKEPRVKPFADAVGAFYVADAHKPSADGFLKAAEMMGTAPRETFFIGDQLFTDIWGANNAGIYSILVKPVDKHEEIQIVLKRKLERPILWYFKKFKTRP